MDVSRVAVETSIVRSKRQDDARRRVLAAAYDLFRLGGTRNIGVDTIVKRSGVAKMSLYRHFKSKEGLVAAFLNRREQLWTNEWVKTEVLKRAVSPADRLLAVFDVLDEWIRSEEFDGCSFTNVLLEYPNEHPSTFKRRCISPTFACSCGSLPARRQSPTPRPLPKHCKRWCRVRSLLRVQATSKPPAR
jgi:AcrR family transcriptional regulator